MSDLSQIPIEMDFLPEDLIDFESPPVAPSSDQILRDRIYTPESAAIGSLTESTQSLPSSMTTNLTMNIDSAIDPSLSAASFTGPSPENPPDLTTTKEDCDAGTQTFSAEQQEVFSNAPMFSSRVGDFQNNNFTKLTQFGLVGVEKQDSGPSNRSNSLSKPASVFANMDSPWSAFICGSQGAGKSHTLSCLLENGLLHNDSIGCLPHPLSAMVFHYDTHSGTPYGQVCEAAYLCSSGIPVTVLVSPSNVWNMTRQYSQLLNLPAGSPVPKVLPLYLSDECLNITTMLKLMSVDPNSSSIPLYMETVMRILRTMAMEGNGADAFAYTDFKNRLSKTKWLQGQSAPLDMRLQLVESFLAPNASTRSTRPAAAQENIWAFEPGSLTIVDLSDPFVSSNDACALFSICLSQFLQNRTQCGRIVALDEAHKFLTQSGEAKALTDDLTAVIRQQRHTGTRVLISTQEPTLSPDIIDLANVTIVHRFSSPAWYNMLKNHLAAALKPESNGDRQSMFESIVALQTGEALLFSPTAVSHLTKVPGSSRFILGLLGRDYLKIKVRARVTADGGRSILASTTGIHIHDGPENLNIPMYVVPAVPQSRFTFRHNVPGQAPATTAPTPHAIGYQTRAQTRSQTHSSTPTQVAQPKTPTDTPWFTKAKTNETMKRQIHEETREQVRAKFQRMDCGTRSKMTMRELSGYVESALSIPAGTLLRDYNSYGNVLKSVARNEVKKLHTASISKK